MTNPFSVYMIPQVQMPILHVRCSYQLNPAVRVDDILSILGLTQNE